MKAHNALGSALIALGAIALPTLGSAKTVEVEITTAPPAPPAVTVEVKPEARPGMVYVPGHYEYDTRAYVWKEPAYIEERHGHKYEVSVIEKRGDRWVYRAGHWDDD